MASDVGKASWWDWLRLQLVVTLQAVLGGLVAPNHRLTGILARGRAGHRTIGLLADLRRKHGRGHLWTRFPFARTLLVLDPASFEEILGSADNAGDAALKRRAMSHLAPDALVISSGDAWQARRRFNEAVLGSGSLHPHAEHFRDLVFAEADRLAGAPAVLRWPDFERFATRVSHQVLLGAGIIEPEMAADLDALIGRGNLPWLPRAAARLAALHGGLAAHLQRHGPPCLREDACLAHDSASIQARVPGATGVTSQLAFWMFVLKDALALHTARTLLLIASHPEAQERARRALRDNPPSTAAAIDGLPFLRACVEEQLRLWTPVPLLLRRAVRPFRLRGDIAIEADDQILIHAGAYHRDPAVFGDRANAFAPAVALDDRAPVYFFSAGRQSCAGRSLAGFLLVATLGALLVRFRFEPVAPTVEPGRVPYLCDHHRIALRAAEGA